MDGDNVVSLRRPDDRAEDSLTEVLRHGARTLLAQAIEAEVQTFLAAHVELVDDAGRRRLVRNGFLPERTIQTGIGCQCRLNFPQNCRSKFPQMRAMRNQPAG